MTAELILHFLNEILQMSKFRLFASRDTFSKIAQVFLKFANVKHNWKIQRLKNSSEKQLKNWHAFWQAKLKNWHALSHLLARWDVKMRSWDAFGTSEHVDHAGKQFSRLYQRCSRKQNKAKKITKKLSWNSQETTFHAVSFLNKVAGCRPFCSTLVRCCLRSFNLK